MAVTNYHRVCDFKQHTFILSRSRDQKPEIKVSIGMYSLRGLAVQGILPASPHFWWFWAFLDLSKKKRTHAPSRQCGNRRVGEGG